METPYVRQLREDSRRLPIIQNNNNTVKREIQALKKQLADTLQQVADESATGKALQKQMKDAASGGSGGSQQHSQLESANEQIRQQIAEAQRQQAKLKQELNSLPAAPKGAKLTKRKVAAPAEPDWLKDSILCKAQALHSFQGGQADDLSFKKGDIISIIDKPGDWWIGYLSGRTGLVPSNYVRVIQEMQQRASSGRRGRFSTRVGDDDLDMLNKARELVGDLQMPAPPTIAPFRAGGTQAEYKRYMITKYLYERWENSKYLFNKKLKEGDVNGAKNVAIFYDKFQAAFSSHHR